MNETEIFAKVIAENDPKRRSELVEELCQSDSGLKGRVEKLVSAHQSPRSFIEDPFLASHAADRTANWSSIGPIKPGETIGPYKLLQQIGEGGMGLIVLVGWMLPNGQ